MVTVTFSHHGAVERAGAVAATGAATNNNAASGRNTGSTPSGATRARTLPRSSKRASRFLVSTARDQPLDRSAPRLLVPGNFLQHLAKLLQLDLGQMLDPDELVASMADRPDQLVELALDRGSVAVLRILDQEHHQESDDGGPGV